MILSRSPEGEISGRLNGLLWAEYFLGAHLTGISGSKPQSSPLRRRGVRVHQGDPEASAKRLKTALDHGWQIRLASTFLEGKMIFILDGKLYFQGIEIATLRQNIPPSLRAEFEEMLARIQRPLGKFWFVRNVIDRSLRLK